MSDSDDFDTSEGGDAFRQQTDDLDRRMLDLERSANGFSRAMSSAFAQGVAGGRQFDDVLKSLALRLSAMAVRSAVTPLAQGLLGGASKLFEGLFGGERGEGATASNLVQPFADGGVLASPTYFPMPGGLGLAGEAGPEAIVPLARGSDGRLGIAGGAAGATHVTIHIAAQDAASFRGSEVYLTGQIARAVERGRRGL